MGWTDKPEKMCQFLSLMLTGDAEDRFLALPDKVQKDWDKIQEQWKEWYPRTRNSTDTTASLLRNFHNLRLDESKLVGQIGSVDNANPWETISFARRLLNAGQRLPTIPNDIKGAEAYENLPSIIQDALPHYACSPSLTTLCSDLQKINHYRVALRLKEHLDLLAQVHTINSLKSQLDSLVSRPRLPRADRIWPSPLTLPTNSSTCNNLRTPVLTLTVRPPVNTAVREAYRDAISKWDEKHGKNTIPDSTTPYPLTPGSPSAGSGECWRCGSLSHIKSDGACQPRELLPFKEQFYRAAIGMILRENLQCMRSRVPTYKNRHTSTPMARNSPHSSLQRPLLFLTSDCLTRPSQFPPNIDVYHLCRPPLDVSPSYYPFVTSADIIGIRPIRVKATISEESELCALDMSLWTACKQELGPLMPSTMKACMGNGQVLKSKGCLMLEIVVESTLCVLPVDVFDSHGSFELLLGKPWLGVARAAHDYSNDLIHLNVGPHSIILRNLHSPVKSNSSLPPSSVISALPALAESPAVHTTNSIQLDLIPNDAEDHVHDVVKPNVTIPVSFNVFSFFPVASPYYSILSLLPFWHPFLPIITSMLTCNAYFFYHFFSRLSCCLPVLFFFPGVGVS
jgi:hypothetical protein